MTDDNLITAGIKTDVQIERLLRLIREASSMAEVRAKLESDPELASLARSERGKPREPKPATDWQWMNVASAAMQLEERDRMNAQLATIERRASARKGAAA